MTHFITPGALTQQQREQYWPAFCPEPSLDERADVLVLTPSYFISKLRTLYSVPSDAALTARARGPDGTTWWPQWVLDAAPLRKFIGSKVECTEDAELFGARFVWVGVPFSGVFPSASSVASPTAPLTPCMVSLVTHNDPLDARAYVWCIVNCDGDVVRLARDVLEVLLAAEIASAKSLVHRKITSRSTMAATSRDDSYVEAAKLICLRVSNVPGFDSASLLPFQDPNADTTPDATDASFMTPVKTRALANRGRVLKVVGASVSKKVDAGGEVVNPFLEDPTPESRATFTRVLQYIVHYGQYDPKLKEILQTTPNDDDYKKILADPAFAQFMRVLGDMTTH